MSNLINSISYLGAIPFLFFYWKRLREDYSSTQIFSSGFYIILSIVFFVTISIFGLPLILPETQIFSPSGLWFWGGVLGLIVGLILSVFKLNLRFYETFEASSVGLLMWLSLVFLIDSIKSQSITSLVSLGVISLLIAGFFFLSARYKKFTWYRSGKIGFSGLATIAAFFLIRSVTALFFPFVLSFVGRVDALISGAISFILFLLLYSLAES